LNARLKPLAKKPPNGPINEANRAKMMEWPRNGRKCNIGGLRTKRNIKANGRGASNSLNIFVKLNQNQLTKLQKINQFFYHLILL